MPADKGGCKSSQEEFKGILLNPFRQFMEMNHLWEIYGFPDKADKFTDLARNPALFTSSNEKYIAFEINRIMKCQDIDGVVKIACLNLFT